MKKEEIPQWAWERGAEEYQKLCLNEVSRKDALLTVKVLKTGTALAAYIAEHEQPPVDPDLIRARKICAEEATGTEAFKQNYITGTLDKTTTVKAALRAIKETRSECK